jgi:hypothetical protein
LDWHAAKASSAANSILDRIRRSIAAEATYGVEAAKFGPSFVTYAECLGARPALARAEAKNAASRAQHGLERG